MWTWRQPLKHDQAISLHINDHGSTNGDCGGWKGDGGRTKITEGQNDDPENQNLLLANTFLRESGWYSSLDDVVRCEFAYSMSQCVSFAYHERFYMKKDDSMEWKAIMIRSNRFHTAVLPNSEFWLVRIKRILFVLGSQDGYPSSKSDMSAGTPPEVECPT